MTNKPISNSRLPAPVPGLSDFHRVKEPGTELLEYIGMDRNERLSPFPDWFLDEVRDSVTDGLLSRYPAQDHLHGQLCNQLGLSEEKLILTPSSDAAFKSVFQAYVQPGDKVAMLDPSYAMFAVYAEMFQGEAVPVKYSDDMEVDTEHLLGVVSNGVKLVLIANPNQPTGTLLDQTILRQVIEKAAETGALVVMDEAYYPFSHFTALPWISEYPNLLVVRTFSKSAGLAGLRIGFAAGHPNVIGNLFRVRAANDLNSMAIMCASKILEHPELVDDYVVEVEAGAELLSERCRSLNLVPLPTNTNFMLIRVAHQCSAEDLVAGLKRRGYLIKGPSATPCVADCVRVSLGPPDLMARFADALADTLSDLAGGMD